MIELHHKKNKTYSFIGNLLLLLVAIIWGFGFSFQSIASKNMDGFTLNFLRNITGAICLIPVIIIRSKINKEPIIDKDKNNLKNVIFAGALCGVFLYIGSNFQQYGIGLYPEGAASSGRGGFISALYVILVPIFGLIFKHKVKVTNWVSVIVAMIGLYFLCFTGGINSVYLGDLVILCCALGFAGQILFIDHFAKKVDVIKMSFVQFLTSSILSFISMLLFEKTNINSILEVWYAVLYLGVVSSGLAFTLQIVGQKYSENPIISAVILSLESVFSVIAGVIILNERLTAFEIVGCGIMFVAILVSQLTPNKE